MKSQNNITPLMEQYIKIKRDYSDVLLFFRMGDFYELFFDDAYLASDILNITLTKRGKLKGKDIPMCGVPHHSSDRYIEILIKKGINVAICEQTETPEDAKKRGYKSIVNRAVVRVITPGTILEDNLIGAKTHNFLLSINDLRGDISISWADISTGKVITSSTSSDKVSSYIARINPSEVLVSNSFYEKTKINLSKKDTKLTILSDSSFNSINSKNKLYRHYGVRSLSSFGKFTYSMIGSLGAILDYIEITKIGTNLSLKRPVIEKKKSFLEIDENTRKNLEINKSILGEKKSSLINILNKTSTNFGYRILDNRLNAPLTDLNQIKERLLLTEFFYENYILATELKEILRICPDFERSLSRLAFYKNSFQDLLTIKKGIKISLKIKKFFKDKKNKIALPKKLYEILNSFSDFLDLDQTLNVAISENDYEIGNQISYINYGYNLDLDKSRDILLKSEKYISDLEKKLIQETKISSLKIKKNNILGYFIEVTSRNADYLLNNKDSKVFIHKQTTANTYRFTNDDLASLENHINTSSLKISELEFKIFNELKNKVLVYESDIRSAADSIGELDFFLSLGFVSKEENWVKPDISNNNELIIISGRHPIVEKNVNIKGETSFIPNDCNLDDKTNIINLITGPNMAGKSTFLRQNAIIIILAQMGCYVPANQAKIGVVDRVFSRIGASDDLSEGHSTFMIEMLETATILNQATEKSFVILDEIGRGTSTVDGLSIAWATLEYLHKNNKSRTLFATHFHELTVLERTLPKLCNLTVKIKELEDKIIFLHKIIKGKANHSFGIEVAKLAGIPIEVIERSKSLLEDFEKDSKTNSFNLKKQESKSSIKKSSYEEKPGISKSENLIKSLNIDEITPQEALHILYKLQTSILKN
ncbi:MAG: DNA mismatch repair protein MutS [Pseudomonadota bacterium]|nr:DNA mismatch repair protein MutS [Pseudomonadota bacterium]